MFIYILFVCVLISGSGDIYFGAGMVIEVPGLSFVITYSGGWCTLPSYRLYVGGGWMTFMSSAYISHLSYL